MPQWIVTTQKNKQQKTVATVGILLLSVFCFAILLFGFVDFASATEQTGPSVSVNTVQEGIDIIEEPLGLPSTDIRTIIVNIIKIAFSLIGIILVVIIMYGGFLYMTAGGNEEQLGRAKDVLKNAVIGLAIVLSAYAIVLFIFKMLGVSMSGPRQQTISLDGYQNFRGSGALGRIVKDHYPMRDQTDVYRNTKIVVTLRNPVDPSSFIINNNNTKDKNDNEIFGDCINLGEKFFNWETDCDTLNPNSIIIEKTGEGIEEIPFNVASTTVMVQYTTSSKDVYGVFTIVMRPLEYLGSSLENVQYKVRLTSKVKLDDPANQVNGNNPSAFTLNPGYYEWQFTCGTEVDLTPPYVKSTWPRNLSTSPKNTVIQIEFNEAIDPTGIQGLFSLNDLPNVENASTTDGKAYYKLSGDNLYLKNGDGLLPVGNFNLTGGYRILEFTPTVPCGRNACGGEIFCLPVSSTTINNKYEFILKAGRTSVPNNWESDPFSGVMDMASNALDGNNDSVIQTATTTLPVFDEWLLAGGEVEPDNYGFWFNINNEIDDTPPYLNQIYPGLDAINVRPYQDWGFLFSKRMRVDTLYDVGIVEYPDPLINVDDTDDDGNDGQCEILIRELAKQDITITESDCVKEQLWKVPRPPIFYTNNQTKVLMNHGRFLDKMRQYYIPYATSTVEDVNFNCFFPGEGPGDNTVYDDTIGTDVCNRENGQVSWTSEGCRAGKAKFESEICDENGNNCTKVSEDPRYDYGCNGIVSDIASTTESCEYQIKEASTGAGE